MSITDDAIFSVSEFLDLTNELLSQRDFTVQGEVIESKALPSGTYFTLKDQMIEATMGCYMSPYSYRESGVALEQGMMVKVGGLASVYKPKGRFSFRVEVLEPVGEGSLRKAYEALKRKLDGEGLFERKRPLPAFVGRVGLITSRTGAVIDDFRKNLLPLGMRVAHYDVRVEGASAAGQIRRALEWFNEHPGHADVLVIIRGGGSLEDLRAFNDEWVVRGVFGSRVPTVVSIGHERDVPLAQLVADASASTPTGAAHTLNGTWSRLTSDVPALASRLGHGYGSALAASSADVRSLTHRIAVHLARLSGRGAQLREGLVHGTDRLGDRIRGVMEQVDVAAQRLDASNPERLLGLGYSIVTDGTGTVIRSAGGLKTGQIVRTRVASGSFTSAIKDVSSEK
ncbi:MAG TPA: exodeoxyribonuclease VII large subunit [Candidatus Paceibacterota bacterium]|nr:exodeoxyribonuclease VII large subunit [Candidatus Paceibacterota bacterium]